MDYYGQPDMGDLQTNIAIVYDRVNTCGGAERLILSLHSIFPQASLFTSVYSDSDAKWAQCFSAVHTSFLQKLPFLRRRHRLIPFLMPIAFEQFDFSKYKLVISVTSESAKGIISLPGTTHVCMCLTPTRYLYHQKNLYLQNQIHKVTAKYITYWDQVAKARPDYWLAISKTVQERIKKYYGQDSTVIYPPVNTDFFTPGPAKESGYFLVVNRLVAHKNTKAIIEVFNSLDLPLLIVGDGPERKKLESLANSNVIFTGQVSDEKLLGYYRGCTSLIFFHEEDFGLTPLEAMSCGKPVIALNIGGASETVIDGQTGMLVNDVVSLSDAIVNFSASRFDSHFIVSHAQNFSQKTFEKNILNFFAKLYP